MQTSNYWNYTGINAISIAGRAPDFYKGKEYKKLAPLYWFFKKYKEDGDKDYYIKCYFDLILNKLDPELTYKELGDTAVLLCWENPGLFCHRRLVAEWFKDKLKIEVNEYAS